LCASASIVRSLIWSRSSCTSAAIVVKKNRPTGAVVSIFSVMLTKSAPASASRSAISILFANSRQSQVLAVVPAC
jgi:hypothetical protein